MTKNLNSWKIDYINKREKLHLIKDIKEGDKIGKKDDEYYIHKSSIKSSISRTIWNKESRENTSNYLKEEFDELNEILENIINLSSNNNIYFLDGIVNFINDIIIGLENLKNTYDNEYTYLKYFRKNKDIVNDLGNIILKLGTIIIKIEKKKELSKVKIKKVQTFNNNSYYYESELIMNTISI